MPPSVHLRLGTSLALALAGCGRAATAPHPTAPTTSGATKEPTLATPPPPARPAPLAIVVDGSTFRCGEPDRCGGVLRVGGEIELGTVAGDATVTHGVAGAPTIDRLALALAMPPEKLDPPGFDNPAIADVPITIAWPDGTRAEGTLPVRALAAADAIATSLRGVVRGPVAWPDDGPAPARPRAMWVTAGGNGPRLYGSAASFGEVDWVLVADDETRPQTCPDGTKTSVSVLRATVYDRRSGKAIASRVFEPYLDPSRCGESMMGQRDTLGAGRWAWDEVRRTIP